MIRIGTIIRSPAVFHTSALPDTRALKQRGRQLALDNNPATNKAMRVYSAQ